MVVYIHELMVRARQLSSVAQGPVVQRWVSAKPAWVKI